eukprot:GDKI01039943.1.p1 GENE.GDKI01039943.1~~GDKI01039943.1.p1  ORF type:complete len:1740 (+),score=447.89 GDKI01039943.1:70-5289(+)
MASSGSRSGGIGGTDKLKDIFRGSSVVQSDRSALQSSVLDMLLHPNDFTDPMVFDRKHQLDESTKRLEMCLMNNNAQGVKDCVMKIKSLCKLLNKPFSDDMGDDQYSYLHKAAMLGTNSALKSLLEFPDTFPVNARGKIWDLQAHDATHKQAFRARLLGTPLCAAAYFLQLESVDMFVKQGRASADVRACVMVDMTGGKKIAPKSTVYAHLDNAPPLWLALYGPPKGYGPLCTGGDGEDEEEIDSQRARTIMKLVECGGDVNGVDEKQNTLLHVAAKAGKVQSVRALLTCGANPLLRDKQNRNALEALMDACKGSKEQTPASVGEITAILKRFTEEAERKSAGGGEELFDLLEREEREKKEKEGISFIQEHSEGHSLSLLQMQMRDIAGVVMEGCADGAESYSLSSAQDNGFIITPSSTKDKKWRNTKLNAGTDLWVGAEGLANQYIEIATPDGRQVDFQQVIIGGHPTLGYVSNYKIQITNDWAVWLDVVSSVSNVVADEKEWDTRLFCSAFSKSVTGKAIRIVANNWKGKTANTLNGNLAMKVDVKYTERQEINAKQLWLSARATGAEFSSSPALATDTDANPSGNSAVLSATPPADCPGTKKARYLEIYYGNTFTSGRCLNLAGVYVYSSGSNIINPAFTVTAKDYADPAKYPGSNLVDNKDNTFYHSNCASSDPWVKIDMGTDWDVERIVLANRQDCCRDRAGGLVIKLTDSNNVVTWTSNLAPLKDGTTVYKNNVASDALFFSYFPGATTVVKPSDIWPTVAVTSPCMGNNVDGWCADTDNTKYTSTPVLGDGQRYVQLSMSKPVSWTSIVLARHLTNNIMWSKVRVSVLNQNGITWNRITDIDVAKQGYLVSNTDIGAVTFLNVPPTIGIAIKVEPLEQVTLTGLTWANPCIRFDAFYTSVSPASMFSLPYLFMDGSNAGTAVVNPGLLKNLAAADGLTFALAFRHLEDSVCAAGGCSLLTISTAPAAFSFVIDAKADGGSNYDGTLPGNFDLNQFTQSFSGSWTNNGVATACNASTVTCTMAGIKLNCRMNDNNGYGTNAGMCKATFTPIASYQNEISLRLKTNGDSVNPRMGVFVKDSAFSKEGTLVQDKKYTVRTWYSVVVRVSINQVCMWLYDGNFRGEVDYKCSTASGLSPSSMRFTLGTNAYIGKGMSEQTARGEVAVANLWSFPLDDDTCAKLTKEAYNNAAMANTEIPFDALPASGSNFVYEPAGVNPLSNAAGAQSNDGYVTISTRDGTNKLWTAVILKGGGTNKGWVTSFTLETQLAGDNQPWVPVEGGRAFLGNSDSSSAVARGFAPSSGYKLRIRAVGNVVKSVWRVNAFWIEPPTAEEGKTIDIKCSDGQQIVIDYAQLSAGRTCTGFSDTTALTAAVQAQCQGSSTCSVVADRNTLGLNTAPCTNIPAGGYTLTVAYDCVGVPAGAALSKPIYQLANKIFETRNSAVVLPSSNAAAIGASRTGMTAVFQISFNDVTAGKLVRLFECSKVVGTLVNRFYFVPSSNAPGPLTGEVPCSFNAAFYTNRYVDLMNAFGTNEAQLLQHARAYGVTEGRDLCQTNKGTACKFNAIDYANLYPDIKAAMGYDEAKLKQHYIDYGILEHRSPCGYQFTSPRPTLYYVRDSVPIPLSLDTAWTADKWYNFAFTLGGDDLSMCIWIDGKKIRCIQDPNLSAANLDANACALGVSSSTPAATSDELKAVLKNFAVWDKVLSEDELNTAMALAPKQEKAADCEENFNQPFC